MAQGHRVSVRIGDRIIDRWQSYSIDADMLTPADAFELRIGPPRPDIWALVPPDSLVEVRIDDTPVMTGYIDERSISIGREGAQISISGRDKAGRMVDESADLIAYAALDLRTLAEQLAAPTFSRVALDNRRNRDLVRGRRSGKAAPGTEPVFAYRSEAPKKVEPGEMRWDVLRQFLEPARLLAWSSADGEELVVGLPNYTQATQFRFFVPLEGAPARRVEGNVLNVDFSESVESRYSTIRVVGSGKGDSARYGAQVTAHTATVRQGPNVDGTGDAFTVRKRLILADDNVKNARDALARANRELAFRDAERQTVELTVQGHSQRRAPGEMPAIYAFDTMAELEIEGIVAGRYLIVAAQFTADRDAGEVTRLKLVPEGTELTS